VKDPARARRAATDDVGRGSVRDMARGTRAAAESGRPARIVFWAGSFELAGTQRFLLELLRRIDRGSFEPTVFSTKAEGELLPAISALGVPVHEFGTGRYLLSPATMSGLGGAARFLHSERIDALCCMLGITTLFGPFVGRAAGVPVVVNSQRNMGYWLRGSGRGHLYGYVSRRVVDGVIVNSSAAADELRRRFGVPAGRVHDIGAGIDVDGIAGAAPNTEVRRALRLDGLRVVGCVAKLSRVKNHALLLRACARVAASRHDVILLVVGEGALRGELEELAGWLGLSGRVFFLGERADVPSLLKLMDVFVLPSTSEGLPNAIMEAMAAGVPVVATRVGGVPELVADGVTGRLVESQDEEGMARVIGELLDDADARERLGRAGHDEVRSRYDIGVSVRAFEDVMNSLIRGASGSRAR
jgi:glycosyltransferase involved in cell wall biosynthesis